MDSSRAEASLRAGKLSMAELVDAFFDAKAAPIEVFTLSAHVLRQGVEVHEASFEEMVDRAVGLSADLVDLELAAEPALEEPQDMGALKARALDHANALMRVFQEQRGSEHADVAFREAYAFRALQGLLLYLEKNWESEDRPRQVLCKVYEAASVALGSEEAVQAALLEALTTG